MRGEDAGLDDRRTEGVLPSKNVGGGLSGAEGGSEMGCWSRPLGSLGEGGVIFAWSNLYRDYNSAYTITSGSSSPIARRPLRSAVSSRS